MISCSEKKELLMDLSGMVNHPCKIICTPWWQGIRWSGANDGEVEEYDRLENLGIPFSVLSEAPGASPWKESIPVRLIPHLLEFEERFPELIFPAMWFLSRHPTAIALLVSSPWLLAMILQGAKKEGWDEQAIVQLFAAPKSRILAACNAQESKGNSYSVKQPGLKLFRHNGRGLLRKSQAWADQDMRGVFHGIGIPAAEAAA